jgi:sugar lactone lactonase YvrE
LNRNRRATVRRKKKYLIALAFIALLYLFPLVAQAFTGGEVASLVIGQASLTSGGAADTSSGLARPGMAAFDSSGDLWVVDSGNNRVLEFLKGPGFTSGEAASLVIGQTSLTSGTSGDTSRTLNGPSSIAFDSSGNLWVVDSGNNRVLEFLKGPGFTSGEAASRVIGQTSLTSAVSGHTSTTLNGPTGVSVDPSGNLWVVDSGNNRVLEFLKGPGFTSGEAASLVIGQTSLTGSAPGDSPVGLTAPTQLVFDSSGNAWVADAGNARVLEFTTPFATGESASLVEGQPSLNVKNQGTTQTEVENPSSIGFDSHGNLWVVDPLSNRVIEFAAPFANGDAASLVIGQTSFTSGGSGDTATTLNGPSSIVFDSSGNAWVTDAGNNRVLEFPSAVTTSTSIACSTSTTIDVGSSTTCTATVTGVTGPVAGEGIAWSSTGGAGRVSFSPATCSLSGSPAACSVIVKGAAAGGVTVQAAYPGDSTNAPGSSSASIIVNFALSSGLVSPSSPTIDLGQSVTLAANPSGGTTPYAYQWYSGSSATCASDTTQLGTGITQLVSPASTTYYCYAITDSSSGAPRVTSPTAQMTVNPAPSAGAITPSGPTIDSGQSVTLTASPSGGTAPYTYQWFTGASCSTPVSGQTGASLMVLPSSTTTYSYKVTDSAYYQTSHCSPGDTVGVDPHLTAGAVTPGSPSIDSGQSITLTANGIGGTGSYSYQWYAGAGCASIIPGQTGASLTVSPSSTTTYDYKVTDSVLAVDCSDANSVTVNSALDVGSVSPASPSVTGGQAVTLTATPSGGTVPYAYQWFTGASCNTLIPGASGPTFATVPSSTTTYSYRVTDSSSSQVSRCSAGDTVTVTSNTLLTAGEITPVAPSIDTGQSLVLAANPSGGTAPYSYQWYSGSNAACSSDTTLLGTGQTQAVSPTSSIYYCYQLTDSEATPQSHTSGTDLVTVDPDVSAGAITPSGPTIDSGQSVTLTANPSGGTVPYAYQWFTGGSCGTPISGQTGATLVVSPSAATTYSYKVTDSASGSACSSGVVVTVDPDLNAGALTPDSPSIDSGQSVTLTANPSGGTGLNTLKWFTGAGCSAQIMGQTGPTLVASPSSTTTYSYKVTNSVSDSACSSGDVVTVNPSLVAGTISPSGPFIDSGQAITLTANPSGGTSPYRYQWYTGAGCTSPVVGETGPTLLISASVTTTYHYVVIDSAYSPVSQCSSGDILTVSPGLTVSVSSRPIDSGQTTVLTASPSGGSGAYSAYAWYPGTACTGTVLGASSTYTTPALANDTSYCVLVIDSLGGEAQAVVDVTVNPALFAAPASISQTAVDSGQTTVFSSPTPSFSGGTAPYTCEILAESPDASAYSAFGAPFPCSPGPITVAGALTTTGVWTFELEITDSSVTPETAETTAVTVTVNPALTLSIPSPPIDSGQVIVLNATASGGSGSYPSYEWFQGTSCTGPILTTSSNYRTGALSSNTSFCVIVTDSLGNSYQTTAAVAVNPALVAAAVSVSPTTVDSGQTAFFSSTTLFSGGTAPYTCEVLAEAPGASTFSDFGAPFACAPGPIAGPEALTTTGVWAFELEITDSAVIPVIVDTNTVSVTVNPPLTVYVPPSTIDGGQPATLTTIPSGGSGTFASYAWYQNSCVGTILGNSSTYTTVALASSATYCVFITDSAGGNASTSVTVNVYPALVAPAISVVPSAVDGGQLFTFSITGSFSGGTPTYNCQALAKAPGASTFSDLRGPFTCNAGGTRTQPGALFITGVWSFELQVTDSSATPVTVTSSVVTVTVNTALAVYVPPVTIDSGQSTTLRAFPSGGSGSYSTYQWYLGTTCTGTVLGTSSAYATASLSTTASYCVVVKDSLGGATSTVVAVAVDSDLVAPVISVAPSTIDTGQSSTLSTSTSFSGGTSTYTCQWLSESPGASGYAALRAPFECAVGATPTVPTGPLAVTGTWLFDLEVTDSASSPVTVVSSPVPLAVSGSSSLAVNVPSVTIDIGQFALLVASPSGGSGSYSSYAWYQGSCSGTVLGTSSTYTTGALASNTTYCVSVTDSLAGTASTTVTVTVDSTLVAPTISVSPSVIDNGQAATLSTTSFGGGAPPASPAPMAPITQRAYICQWLVESPGSSVYSGLGTSFGCSAGGMPSVSTGVLAVSGVWHFELRVNDSSATPASIVSTAVTVTVNQAMGFLVPPVTIDSGQSAVLTASPTGGSGSYSSFAWYLGTTCTGTILGTSATYTTSVLASPTNYCILVTDSLGGVAQATATVVVATPLAVPTMRVTPTVIDSGQLFSFSISGSFTGGTPTYTCQVLEKAPGASLYTDLDSPFACTAGGTGTTLGALLVTGVWSFELRVTDSSATQVTLTSLAATVIVNPALKVSVSAPPIDSGQSLVLNASSSGGSGLYSYYQWYLGTACAGTVIGTSSNYMTGALASGTSYCVEVTDSNGGDAHTTVAVTVNPALTPAVVSVSPTTVDSGQTAFFSSPTLFSGGTAPYTCEVLAEAPGASTFSDFLAPFACAPGPISGPEALTTPGVWSFEFEITDSSATVAIVTSSIVTIGVNTPMTVFVTPPTIDSGQSVVMTAFASGGSDVFSSYAWYQGSCSGTVLGTSSNYTTGALTSDTTYCLSVTDSIGGNASTPVTVTVDPNLVAPIISPSPSLIDSGQGSILSTTASFSGGTTAYLCQWLVESPGSSVYSGLGAYFGCSAGGTPGVSTGVLGVSGVWHFELRVNDSSATLMSVTSASVVVTVNQAMDVSIAPVTIYSGQSAVLTASPTGGSGSYSSFAWYLGTTCTGPVLGTSATYTTVVLSSSTQYCVLVSDSVAGQAIEAATVTVNPALSTGPVTPSSLSIDGGQSVLLSASPSGGVAPYSYQWFTGASCTSPISGATGPTYSASPSSTTSYYVQVSDAENSPASSCSPGDLVTVELALNVGSITPSSPAIDDGQSIMLSASPTNGVAPYSYQWFTGASCTSPISGATGPTYSASPSSTTSYYVQVNDSSSAGAESGCSAGDTVTVESSGQGGGGGGGGVPPTPLSAGSISPSSPSIDDGQSIPLSANPSGGVAPYLYQWFTGAGCTSPIAGATHATFSASPSSTTTYYVKVTDSEHGPVSECSSGDTLTVNLALDAGAISPQSPVISKGASVVLTANPSGGTGPISYQWYTVAGCRTSPISGASGFTFSASPSSTTSYYVQVNDSSSAGAESGCSAGDAVTVKAISTPALSAGPVTPSSPSIDGGQSILLSANPSGGVAPYSYRWFTGASCTSPISGATGSTYIATAGATYYYQVTDSASAVACSAGDLVTVNPALVAPTIAASATSIDSNGSLSLFITAGSSGGASPFICQWLEEAPGAASYTPFGSPLMSGCAAQSILSTDDLSAAGTWHFELEITDSASSPVTVVSPAVAVQIVTPSSTSVNCFPTGITIGSSATCTATVSGASPTGNVTWSVGAGLSITGSPTCSLSSQGSCAVVVTGVAPGSMNVSATYYGDQDNAQSGGHTLLSVTGTTTTSTSTSSVTSKVTSTATISATVSKASTVSSRTSSSQAAGTLSNGPQSSTTTLVAVLVGGLGIIIVVVGLFLWTKRRR